MQYQPVVKSLNAVPQSENITKQLQGQHKSQILISHEMSVDMWIHNICVSVFNSYQEYGEVNIIFRNLAF